MLLVDSIQLFYTDLLQIYAMGKGIYFGYTGVWQKLNIHMRVGSAGLALLSGLGNALIVGNGIL